MQVLVRLMRDEGGQTYTEYLVVTLAIVVAVVGMSRMVVNALVSYLRRIYLIVSLPIP
jgi:Flp pilus assembly pilin Flp